MNLSPFKTFCYVVAVAMGAGVIITNFLLPQSPTVVADMLGVGLIAIGLASLQ